MYHMDFMNKWIDLYDKNIEVALEARRQFKRSNPKNTPFPIDLQGKWAKYCTLEWATKQIQNKIEDVGIYSNIKEDEINVSGECKIKVKLEFYKILFPYSFHTTEYFNIHHYICFNRNKWSFTRNEISSNVGIWSTLLCITCRCKETILRF